PTQALLDAFTMRRPPPRRHRRHGPVPHPPPGPPPQPDAQPESGFEAAADEAVAVAAHRQLDPAPVQPQPGPVAAPDAAAQLSAAASTAGQSKDAAEAAADLDAQSVTTIPDPNADAQLLAAAAVLNAAALASTGRAVSLRALQSGLRIGQRRAQRIQAQLAREAS
ncbi:hypothetical protein ACFVHW_07040, partial [Streptomyces sp. NPDC127110]